MPRSPSNVVGLHDAAIALGITPGALRSRLRRSPIGIVQRGGGRGNHMLVDLDALRPRTDAVDPVEAFVLDLAARIPDALADAAWQTFIESSGAHKRALPAELVAAWYRSTTAILDVLRRSAPVGELFELPAKVVALRRIFDDARIVPSSNPRKRT